MSIERERERARMEIFKINEEENTWMCMHSIERKSVGSSIVEVTGDDG